MASAGKRKRCFSYYVGFVCFVFWLKKRTLRCADETGTWDFCSLAAVFWEAFCACLCFWLHLLSSFVVFFRVTCFAFGRCSLRLKEFEGTKNGKSTNPMPADLSKKPRESKGYGVSWVFTVKNSFPRI